MAGTRPKKGHMLWLHFDFCHEVVLIGFKRKSALIHKFIH